MRKEYQPDSYEGRCSCCGNTSLFVREHLAIRETYSCPFCRASLRERAQVSCILSEIGFDKVVPLSEAVYSQEFKDLCVYEPGTIGAARKFFKALPNYYQSDYFPDKDSHPNIEHQDLSALTYEDDLFNIVITSDIIEHVQNPRQVFKEVHRVLKPNGKHIFTAPLQLPLDKTSTLRAEVKNDELIHLLPPQYHGNGKGGKSLVYFNFGLDIVDMLYDSGFLTSLIPAETESRIANKIITVVAHAI